ncbi:MAG: helix-turn-helix transcriptional regulator [Bacteroidales bacterium]|nr:helix-turn-helix transcriptional regulator [Bacteroidales bacterium]
MIIKEVIKEKGYSVSSFAEKLGMKQESLSRIINGNPTIGTLEKIATALNVDITDLFAKRNPEVKGYIKIKGVLYEVNSFDDLENLMRLR